MKKNVDLFRAGNRVQNCLPCRDITMTHAGASMCKSNDVTYHSICSTVARTEYFLNVVYELLALLQLVLLEI